MKKVKSGNLPIHYTLTGKAAQTLLFVHGSFLDESWWQAAVEFFKEDYTVVTMDLGGHGQSGLNRKTWTVEKFGDDVGALINQLELKNVILIGHSMGADAILEAAVINPDPIQGIIAIENFKNAGMPLPDEFKAQAEELIKKLEVDFSANAEAYARMVLLTPETSPEISAKVIAAYRSPDPLMGLLSTKSIFDYSRRERKLLKQLPFKLNLINVDYRPTQEEPLKKFAKEGYELRHMQGTCHFPMLENPVILNEKIRQSLSTL